MYMYVRIQIVKSLIPLSEYHDLAYDKSTRSRAAYRVGVLSSREPRLPINLLDYRNFYSRAKL